MSDRSPRRELPPLVQRAVGWLPEPARGPARLLARTAVDSVDDRIVGLSAEVAFFAILSLPPLLLTVVAALGYLPGNQSSEFVAALIRAAGQIFTRATVTEVIAPIITDLVESPRTDVLSIGFALAVLSASRAVRVMLTAVSIAYDLDGVRPGLRQRVVALLLTLALFVVVPVVVPLLLAGPDFGLALARSEFVPGVLADLWPLVYWAGVGGVGVLTVAVIHHVAAPWWTPFRRDLPGAVLAVVIWVVASAGLRYFTRTVFADGEIYGILAGPLALLVWLYVLAFGVLVGGELNAELERLYPSPEQRGAPASERLRRLLPGGVVYGRDTDAPAEPGGSVGESDGASDGTTGPSSGIAEDTGPTSDEPDVRTG